MVSRQKHRVPEGGIMSSRKISFSKDTQDLLRTMMKEAHLTNLQQRKINDRLQKGEDLPVRKDHRPCQSVNAKRSKCTDFSRARRGLRTLETIQKLEETSQQDHYTPPSPISSYNSSLEKEKLHNIMAYGKAEMNGRHQELIRPPKKHDDNDEVDRFDEVLKEIEERKEFLKDMAKLGADQMYHSHVTTEISQKIRELELIDKERTKHTIGQK